MSIKFEDRSHLNREPSPEARRLFDEALTASLKKDYDDAVAKLEMAHAIIEKNGANVPAAFFMLAAQCSEGTNRNDLATEFYQKTVAALNSKGANTPEEKTLLDSARMALTRLAATHQKNVSTN